MPKWPQWCYKMTTIFVQVIYGKFFGTLLYLTHEFRHHDLCDLTVCLPVYWPLTPSSSGLAFKIHLKIYKGMSPITRAHKWSIITFDLTKSWLPGRFNNFTIRMKNRTGWEKEEGWRRGAAILTSITLPFLSFTYCVLLWGSPVSRPTWTS